MGKIKAGIGAAAGVLVVTGWLMISHTLDWGMSAVLPQ
ncbi:hypothetical protein MCHLDSM_05935 [Mycolicibacterium chlorophenolicum]|uniref:Uncharacterized protein n=1 Tax=Mycolicibacterium chlorophenolicum TaxID=37916 RepID=A0A0J6VK40_9MYCO|nr:hypothetical protein MCHLDSM_05935 [Mycolicibacterium chlorophenolicum]